jgi:hypothetical protein
MIKHEGIQQISKSAQLNTEKVYEVVDEIVTTLAQNFPSCQVAYNEEQNRFGTVIKYLSIIITPLFKSVEVVISDNTEPIFTALLQSVKMFLHRKIKVQAVLLLFFNLSIKM